MTTATKTPATRTKQEQAEEPKLATALLGEVMAEIGSIAKAQKNSQQGFMFRGIDQVQNALYPLLAARGLWISPVVLDERFEQRTNDKGRVSNVTFVKVQFVFHGPAGDTATIGPVWGEGSDFADKATGKAHSMAMKTALLEGFSIPTEDQQDADHDTEVADSVAPRVVVEGLLKEYGRTWPELADIMQAALPEQDITVEKLRAVSLPQQVRKIREVLADHHAGSETAA